MGYSLLEYPVHRDFCKQENLAKQSVYDHKDFYKQTLTIYQEYPVHRDFCEWDVHCWDFLFSEISMNGRFWLNSKYLLTRISINTYSLFIKYFLFVEISMNRILLIRISRS